jgi:hypothetical protein
MRKEIRGWKFENIKKKIERIHSQSQSNIFLVSLSFSLSIEWALFTLIPHTVFLGVAPNALFRFYWEEKPSKTLLQMCKNYINNAYASIRNSMQEWHVCTDDTKAPCTQMTTDKLNTDDKCIKIWYVLYLSSIFHGPMRIICPLEKLPHEYLIHMST